MLQGIKRNIGIFDLDSTTLGIQSDRFWTNVENWYFGLDRGTFGYVFTTIVTGPLTRPILGGLQDGYDIYTEEECLNVKLTYAIDEAWWGKSDKMKNEYNVYRLRCYTPYFYTTETNSNIVRANETLISSSKDSTLFYDLLKDSNGNYKTYKTIYGSDARVAKYFETSENMVLELLESSPNTAGLVDEMKVIIHKLKNNIRKMDANTNWKDEFGIVWGNESEFTEVKEPAA